MSDRGEKMMCHYEIMELEMDCKTEDVKKQYKVMALKYHPDRNHGNEEEATLKFKQVSAAYAVLSDPHERKWYDDHREAILRGGTGTAEDVDGDDSINVWQYFDSSCYSGFSDDSPMGFYNVYRDAFDEITEMESDKSKSDPSLKYSTAAYRFGNSTTPIAEVLQFYAEWENFASTLKFAWADTYLSVDAPNRQTRRVMEAENMRARNAARKEYTNNVRSLASFVKKRDPRYIAYEAAIAQKRAEAEELKRVQKAEELRVRKEKRERLKEEFDKNTDLLETRNLERKEAFLLADNSDEEPTLIGAIRSDDERDAQKSIKKVSLDDFIASRAAGAEGEGAVEGGEGAGAAAGGCGAFGCALCGKEFKTEAQLAHHNISRPHRIKVQDAVKSQKKGKDKKVKEKKSKKGEEVLQEVVEVGADMGNMTLEPAATAESL